MTNELKVIFWREVPVDVDIDFYIELKKYINIEIYSLNDYDESRKKSGYNKNDLEQEVINSRLNKEAIVKKNIDAIHVLAGIRGSMSQIFRILKKYHANKILVLCERPNECFDNYKYKIKTLVSKVGYWCLARYYRKKIVAMLVMGKKGQVFYKKIGFKNIFPFMYCSENLVGKIEKQETSHLRCVYVGRISKQYKGVDVLGEAVKNIENISLDVYGGYGDYVEEFQNILKSVPVVHYHGQIQHDRIIDQLGEYDVAIVPSKYDGWNLLVNQAIQAGIAVICSNNCGSDELVVYSKAGMIFKNYNVHDLKEKIEILMENKEMLKCMKKNAENYRTKILPESVAVYFVDIIKFLFGEKEDIPICPWREESNEVFICGSPDRKRSRRSDK